MSEIITGTIEISAGIVSSGLTVDNGEVTVLSGGTVTDTEAVNYGYLWVDPGGSIRNISLRNSGGVFVSGGSAVNLVMETGGQADIMAGVLTSGTIRDKGIGAVYTGGSALNVAVSAGGRYLVYGGYAENTVVSSGGSFTVQMSGGVANKTTVEAGASVKIVSAGEMRETILNGARLDVISGTIKATTINGGELHVSSGAPAPVSSATSSASSSTVSSSTTSSATAPVPNSAENTVLNGGMFVLSGGTAKNTTVNSGAFILSGGFADTTRLFSGTVVVSGGTAQNTTLMSSSVASGSGSSGGTATQPGGSTGNTTAPVCILDVLSGGMAVNTTVSNGLVRVFDGATANRTIVTGGTLHVSNGATANTITMRGGMALVFAGALALSATVSAGSLTIDGGTVNTASVTGGALLVSSGGIATAMTLRGGTTSILAGAGAVSTTILNSGWLSLNGCATANEVTVSGGTFHVLSGGVANAVSIHGGTTSDWWFSQVFSGHAVLDKGGIISGVTVNDGGKLTVSGGGILTGDMVFTGGADVFVESGGILAFDITGATPGAKAKTSGLTYLEGAPVYTLTVSDIQAAGVYALSAEAAGFRDTITVQSQLGTTLGTLTVGNTVFLNNQYYTLRVTDNVLNLTVSAEAPVPPNAPKTVYVKADWSTLTAGTVVELDGGVSATIGLDAFATGREATNAVAADSTVVVAGGNVPFAYGISRDTVALNGATVSQSAIVRNGKLTLNSGSFGNSITVSNHALLAMNSGSLGSDITVSNGGTFTMNAGTQGNTITVSDGGLFTLNSGSTAIGVTGSNGSSITIKSGGTLRDFTISGGTFTVEAGGSLAGTGSFTGYGAAVTVNGAMVFDISGMTECTAPLFAAVPSIEGTPSFIITVSDDQTQGYYTLASFSRTALQDQTMPLLSGTYTLVNTAGQTLGTLTVGGQTSINGRSCKLYRQDDQLLLRIHETGTQAIVYVNSEWEKLSPGSTVEVNGTTLTIWKDAFGSLDLANEAVGEGGVVTVVGGTFSSEQLTRDVVVRSGTLSDCVVAQGVSLILNSGAVGKDLSVQGGTLVADDGATLSFTRSGEGQTAAGSTIIVNGTVEFDMSALVSTGQSQTAVSYPALASLFGRPDFLFADGYESLPTVQSSETGGGTTDRAVTLHYYLPVGTNLLLNPDKTLSVKRGDTVRKVKNNGHLIGPANYEAQPLGKRVILESTYTPFGNITVESALFSGMAYIDSRYYKINILEAEEGGIWVTVSVGSIQKKDVYLNSDWSNKYYNDVVQLVGGGTARVGKDAFDNADDALENVGTNKLTIEGGTHTFSKYLRKAEVLNDAVIHDTTLGTAILQSGATGVDLTVTNLSVMDGAVCRNVTLRDGGSSSSISRAIEVKSGGVLTETCVFTTGFNIRIDGTLDFDISGRTPGDQPLVFGLKYITGDPSFTLTVGASQECGRYVLASEITGFHGIQLTVADETGAPAMMLAVGDTVRIGDRYYMLRTMNDRLTLSVSAEEPDPLPGVITVNAAWAGYQAGQQVILADGSTAYIGYDAFADLSAAYDNSPRNGVVMVVGGTFTPEYGIIRNTVTGNGVLIVNATVENNGCLTVGNGAKADGITVVGGTLSLNDGGVMAGTTTVKDGGVLVLEKTIVQNGTIMLMGGTICLAGYELSELVEPQQWYFGTGGVTGTGKFKAGTSIKINHLYCDISGEAPDNAPLFEGISAVTKGRNVGTGFLQAMIAEDQSAGTYYLATDAADIQTVQVRYSDDRIYNVGISDGAVRIGDRSYRITLTESGDLYLTIRNYEPQDTVYINTAWAGLDLEETVTLVGGGTAMIGVNAFATLDAGRRVVRKGGTVVLDGGGDRTFSDDSGLTGQYYDIGSYQSADGVVTVSNGCTVSGTAYGDVKLVLNSGARGVNLGTYGAGSLWIREGAELDLTTATTFREGTSVTIDGTVNYIVSGTQNRFGIDGLDQIRGNPAYRVILHELPSALTSGTGMRSAGVALFSNTYADLSSPILLVNAAGEELGVLSTDSAIKIDDEYYASLSVSGSLISMKLANYSVVSDVYFNSDWSGLDDGTDVVLASGSTATIGINAFSDLKTAFANAQRYVYIEGGAYDCPPGEALLGTSRRTIVNGGAILSGTIQTMSFPADMPSMSIIGYYMTLKDGVVLKDLTFQYGVIDLEGDPVLEGSISVEGSTITVTDGRFVIDPDDDITFVNSTLSVRIAGSLPGENAVVEGISNIRGTPKYACSLNEDNQATGTYLLATGASGIDRITLDFVGRDRPFEVSVSDPFGISRGDYTYLLSRNADDDLFLTVSSYIILDTVYIGADWNGLARGTVVEVPGGTAVIGTDAFSNVQYVAQNISLDSEIIFVSGSHTFVKSYSRKLVMAGQAVAYDSTLSAGSALTLRESGKAYNIVVSENSALVLQDRSEAGDISVVGTLSVGNHASVRNLQISSGATITVEAGAKLTGWGVFSEGSDITINGTLDFDISGAAAGGSALFEGLSSVRGDTSYTITIGAEQTPGFYYLASGADGFASKVTLSGTDGSALGTLMAGTSARIDGMLCTLNLGDGILSLTVAAASGTDTRSDVDGNGVSDVLFQYTGGDNQTGYWLNGKDTWRSSNAPHPVEWTLLGAYDMDGDGLADSVFVGNTVVNGRKGAYIGYYKSGIDTDENWVNIDYLENTAENVWANKIGNLTGNPGANSIVWHCAGLGAIGVWTDGTSEWTQLGIGFDANWTLVGCGDFNGDGRDSIVMSYLDGTKYYAIDIDGSAVDMGALNWSGWEVRAIGDFAGDGKDDMVLFHKETGSMVMCADGSVDAFVSIGQLDANDWFVVGAGDYNGDGKDDLLVRQYSTGMLGYYSACDTSKWVEMGRGVDMDWTVIA